MTSSAQLGHDSLLSAWIGIVRRRWPWGLGVFAVIVGLAALMLFTAHPVYRAQASLRLGEPPPQGGVSPTASLLGAFGLGDDAFSNDLELLASRTLAESVVADGSLNVKLLAQKDWHRDSIFEQLLATPLTDDATFEVEWRGNEVLIRQTAPSEEQGLVATVLPGQSVVFGGVSTSFRPWREGMPSVVRIKTLPFSQAVSVERQRIVSERTRREANVVEISYDHTDPDLAETVVRSVVDRFVAFRTQIQSRESGETVDSLRVVANKTLAELHDAETALEEYQRTSGLVAPDAQSAAFIERYSTLLTGLMQARGELIGIDDVLERIAAEPDSAGAWTSLVSHPLFLQNETVGLLLAQLTTLEAARNEVASRRTVESREHRVILDQIRYLVQSLNSVAEDYRTSLVEQIRVSEEMVATMEAELGRMPALVIDLVRRQRDVRILTEIVVLTEQRLRQEELRQALTFANIQVIDSPKLLFKPVWPRKLLGLAVGFIVGGVFGALSLVVSERSDPSVRSVAAIRPLLGAPVLAAPYRTKSRIVLSPSDARAVLDRVGHDSWGARRMVLAPLDEGPDAADLVEAISRAGEADDGGGTRRRTAGWSAPTLDAAPSIQTFATASEAVDGDVPVVLVLRCGQTRKGDLARAVDLVTEAGGKIGGAVLVCGSAKEARAAWG